MNRQRECVQAFSLGADTYDDWYDRNPALFDAELAAIRLVLPSGGDGIEIGCGTGRFAAACGIRTGIEPAEGMARIAAGKGIQIISGYAEDLPVEDKTYDFALMATVDCFLENVPAAFTEVNRILREHGTFIIAFLNRSSPLGQVYERNKNASDLYRHAIFHTSSEIEKWLEETGFTVGKILQTICSFEDSEHSIYEGSGSGLFTVVQAQKN